LHPATSGSATTANTNPLRKSDCFIWAEQITDCRCGYTRLALESSTGPSAGRT
jgi:hypothetical protein